MTLEAPPNQATTAGQAAKVPQLNRKSGLGRVVESSPSICGTINFPTTQSGGRFTWRSTSPRQPDRTTRRLAHGRGAEVRAADRARFYLPGMTCRIQIRGAAHWSRGPTNTTADGIIHFILKPRSDHTDSRRPIRSVLFLVCYRTPWSSTGAAGLHAELAESERGSARRAVHDTEPGPEHQAELHVPVLRADESRRETVMST